MMQQRVGLQDERGAGIFKLIIIIGLVVGGVIFALKVVPAYYDFRLVKELAKRVATEYSQETLAEVNRRVKFEFDRSRITLPEDGFIIQNKENGYRVIIDYVVPMDITVDGKDLTFGKLKEIHFQYDTGL